MKEQTIAVTDIHCIFITTCDKTHSSYQMKLQKEVISTQNNQTVKKGTAHAKNRQHEKSCEIKGGGPEVAVMVELWQNF